MKAAIFHPEALAAIRTFSAEVRRELGKAIYDLQLGERLAMPLSRPMKAVGPGVEELRIRDKSGSYRVFYLARRLAEFLSFTLFLRRREKHLCGKLIWRESD
jgi:phage-related protein